MKRLVLPFDKYPGKWLAISVATGDIVVATDTPEEVVAYLRQHEIDDAAMVRAPDADEPLTVGLG